MLCYHKRLRRTLLLRLRLRLLLRLMLRIRFQKNAMLTRKLRRTLLLTLRLLLGLMLGLRIRFQKNAMLTQKLRRTLLLSLMLMLMLMLSLRLTLRLMLRFESISYSIWNKRRPQPKNIFRIFLLLFRPENPVASKHRRRPHRAPNGNWMVASGH